MSEDESTPVEETEDADLPLESDEDVPLGEDVEASFEYDGEDGEAEPIEEDGDQEEVAPLSDGPQPSKAVDRSTLPLDERGNTKFPDHDAEAYARSERARIEKIRNGE